MTDPQIIDESKSGPAVTGESIVSPELSRGLPDQSLPRSPEGPGFKNWWREYQEKMRNAQESALGCHPLQQFAN